ncbi:hypothetical protein [Pararhodospirillum photometricum]|nr:hypothetical protein [Pararhodospirillum photometricum]
MYAPTYPADAAARERLRDEGLKKDGSLVHQVPGALPPAPQDP